MGQHAGNRHAGRKRFALLLGFLLTAPAVVAQAADWASVIMYHRFGEGGYSATNIRIDQFEAHVKELASGAYTVLPLPEVIRRMRAGEDMPDRTVAITIDDAFLSVYKEAWLRLRAAKLPFTVFVSTDEVDAGSPGYMSWDQLRELVAGGVTIGSQTASHPHMPNNSAARNQAEIAKSNARFKAELGLIPTVFAYPYGEFGSAVKDVVRQAGFAAAFGQQSGVAYAAQDPYTLPRWAMNENYGDLQRFRRAVNALPFRVKDVTPADTVLRRNPPSFGFTVEEGIENLENLACYSSHHNGVLRLERLGERRIEVRVESAYPPGRARINCTVLGPEGRWRWFGTQFFVPKS